MKKVLKMQKIKNKILELCNYLKNVMKKYPVVSFYILSNFLNGTVMRLFTTGHFGLRAVLMEFGFVLLLASFSLLLKKNHRNFYYALTSILMLGPESRRTTVWKTHYTTC